MRGSTTVTTSPTLSYSYEILSLCAFVTDRSWYTGSYWYEVTKSVVSGVRTPFGSVCRSRLPTTSYSYFVSRSGSVVESFGAFDEISWSASS